MGLNKISCSSAKHKSFSACKPASIYYMEDSELSFKAKGIISFMIDSGKKDITTKLLIEGAKNSRDSVLSGIKELKTKGYLKPVAIKSGDGKYRNYIYQYNVYKKL